MGKFSERQKELQYEKDVKEVQDLANRNFKMSYIPPTMIGSEKFCNEWNKIVRETGSRLGVKLEGPK